MNIKKIFDTFEISPTLKTNSTSHIKTTYQYWRLRIFYSIYLGYLFYYFSRKSLTFVIPFLMEDLKISKGDLGLITSLFAIIYGISKFINGILCDRSNPRYFMSIGLMLTGIFNVMFGISSTLFWFCLFWSFNAWFQGCGWPACTKQLTYWFSRSERGTWWSVCTTSHAVGGFLIAYVAVLSAQEFGWRYGLFIPGILCFLIGCWLMNRLRNIPQTLGLPSIEVYKNEAPTSEQDNSSSLTTKQILFRYILCNRNVWILGASYFFVYVIRESVNNWCNLYLIETKNHSVVQAAGCVGLLEFGGFFGLLFAGLGSDYWFKGNRIPLIVISALGIVLALMGLWYFSLDNLFFSSCLMFITGFLISIPQMLVGLFAAELVIKQAVSTSNGFVGFFAYLGATFGGYPLIKIAEIWGWEMFIISLIICSITSVIVLIPMWLDKSLQNSYMPNLDIAK